MRLIKTCQGIGDFLWLAMKLVNAGERFDFQIHEGKPQRGKQIFDLLPNIAASCTYVPDLGYNRIKAMNAARMTNLWSHLKQQEFALSANEWLEAGHRIERFLPDLKTTFRLEYATTETDKHTANTILKEDKKFIGIYGSAYSTQRAWNGWMPNKWYEFIRLMYRENQDFVFVVIGADFDTDLGSELIKILEVHGIPHINTIGQPLSVVIEMLKKLSYFIGFPSGLSILNETLGKNGFMFYPPALMRMMNAWADPERIESGDYKGAQFCEPERVHSWIINDYKLLSKL